MAEKPKPLDAAERIVKLLKELVLLALVAYLGWYLVPFVPKWTAKLDNAQISEVSLAGVGFKLTQAEQKLEQAAKTVAPQKSPRDEGIAPEKKLIVEALESVRAVSAQVALPPPASAPVPATARPLETARPNSSDVSFWVYLGIAKGDAIPSKNFRIAKLPAPGDVIAASTDVYKRSSAPKFKGEEWYLGDTVGVVRSGQTVAVRKVEKIESTQPGSEVVWAEVVAAK